MTGPIRDVTQGPPGVARGDDTGADGLGPSLSGGGGDDGQGLSMPSNLADRPSTLERFLAGADTLARFRDDPVSIPSSPVTQPGEVSRAGDVQADAGAHLGLPATRGPDVTVGATVAAAGVDARLSIGTSAPGQAPWVNATVQVREPAQLDRATMNLRLIASGSSGPNGASLPALVQATGFAPAAGPATTGALTIRGAMLEIAAPGGRTVLLATTDGGAVLRTGGSDARTAVFVRAPDGYAVPAQAVSASPGGLPFGGLGLAAGSLAGLLAMLGGTEQQMALWLARPDGSTTMFPPANAFKGRWSELRDRLSHDPAHILRLEAVLYDCLAARFAALGVDLAARPPALRDVVWAMAVEHGPWADPQGADILSQVSYRWQIAQLSDADLIAALFDEQLRQDASERLIHYSELGTDDLHRAVAQRLSDERQVALDRLSAQS